jgi:hypothetical protein
MNDVSLPKNSTHRCASALLRISAAALLILTPVTLAFAQNSGPSDNAPGRNEGARPIGPESESDPISLEAIQEGVKNFELRRETDGKAPNAAAAEVRRRARDAIKSDEKAEDRMVLPSSAGRPAMQFHIKVPRRRRSRRKPLAGRSLRRRLARNLQPIIPRAASRTFSRLRSIASAFREGRRYQPPGSIRAYAPILRLASAVKPTHFC